ncbi:MAG: DUF4367 domain-containing protein [Peptostreptococcaceae bacterium]
MGKSEKIDEIDKLLYEYCPRVEEMLLSTIPYEDDIEYEFSSKFERKMKKMIKEQKRGPFVSNLYKGLKIASVFIVVGITVFSLSMSVEAVRTKLLEVIKEVYEEFSVYEYKGTIENISGNISDNIPKHIPNGYEVIEQIEEDEYLLISYKNNMDYLTYNCFKINNDRVYVDTEDADITKVYINGMKADHIEKGNSQMLIWQNNGYGYYLNVDSIDENYKRFDTDELIKIAESIK